MTKLVSAQPYLSGPSGNFTVNQIRGCVPLNVQVTDMSGNPDNDPRVYNFDYNPGDRIPVNPTTIEDTTYAIPGSYLIIQVVGSEIDSIRIEALEPRTPQFELINCTENRVFVDIQDDYYDRLEIDFGEGAEPITVSTNQPSYVYSYLFSGEYEVTVRGLLDEGEDSSCGDSTATISTFEGETFPTATLSLVEVLDEQSIRLEYELPENVSYLIEVSENGSTGSRSYPLEPGSSETVLNQAEWDTRNNYYCLAITAIDPCSGLDFPSNPLCTITLDAVAGELQNELSWESEPELFNEYQVLRDGEELTSTSATTYVDTDVACQQIYAYQVSSSTAVGESRSEIVPLTTVSTTEPTPVTSADARLEELSIVLEWAEMPNARQYYIYRSEGDNSAVLYDSLSPDTNPELSYLDDAVEIDQEYCYQLSYLDDCGNESVLSEPTCQRIPSQAQLYFPNAFTPNGDGLNDVFVYKAALLESVTFEVFNRWGELLFSTDQRDVGWDGTYQGVVAPQGTYLYQIRVVDQLGNEFSQHGKFVLLGPAP